MPDKHDRRSLRRAVSTAWFQHRVYVLHAFQKKSKKGSATPQPDIEVIRQGLARAAALNAAQE